MQTPHRLPSIVLTAAACVIISLPGGCTVLQESTRATAPFQKIVPDRGAPLFGTIVGQSDTTLVIAIADGGDTLVIDRARVKETLEVPRRQQMLMTQLSGNPSLFYYRALAAPINVGVTAEYIWWSWMENVRAVELGGEIRVLPFGADLRGFYLAASLNYAAVVADHSAHSFSRWWSNGWLVGWQWFPMYNVAAGICMGAEVWHFQDSESVYRELGYSGMPLFRLQVGYAW